MYRLPHNKTALMIGSLLCLAITVRAESMEGYILTGLSRIDTNEYAFLLVPPHGRQVMLKKGREDSGIVLVDIDNRLRQASLSLGGKRFTLRFGAIPDPMNPDDTASDGPVDYQDFSLRNYAVLKESLRKELALREHDYSSITKNPLDIKLLDRLLEANPESLGPEERKKASELLDGVYRQTTPSDMTQLLEYHMWFFMQLK